MWLEDQVGHTGPAATAPIPRDTTPPAAPQSVSVTAPDTARTAQGFDVHWRNIVDAGAPIVSARYKPSTSPAKFELHGPDIGVSEDS